MNQVHIAPGVTEAFPQFAKRLHVTPIASYINNLPTIGQGQNGGEAYDPLSSSHLAVLEM